MPDFNFVDMTNVQQPSRKNFNEDHTLKIGIIGAGNRVKKFILPLLRKNNKFELVGFYTRSEDTRKEFSAQEDVKSFSTIESLGEECDAFVVCVAANASETVNQQVSLIGKPFLVETPCTDAGMLKYCDDKGIIVGALEQWPFLPVEQFKKSYISKFFRTAPYLAVNDCRSLDYHGMAQVRSYVGLDQQPAYVKGQSLSLGPAAAEMSYRNNSGDVIPFQDNWDFGTVQMDRSILVHHFSYTCKIAPFRSLQTLRAYSADGTVISGKLKSAGSDYDILEFSHLSDGETVNSIIKVETKKIDGIEVTASITDEVTGLSWKNPYADLGLDDQKSAVMTVLDGFRKKIISDSDEHFYSAKNSLTDIWITTSIKQSGQDHKPVQMGNLW